ncbi:SDR family oxidoreductase [Persicimonas caeni]|uniref:SDR family oxidoreductase n=1 Tax=Persicimonas caeni TaxID=2292766 RepID=A0A4Y6Q1P8_PERCE|nr:SDR family oxidoreductase [Persicimonas caeni]QDG54483.1 SDR family oxidoreductase [Persicimonas caeni]QED35704.1 SDR family oxidoreductase [Persicimonas caeni]
MNNLKGRVALVTGGSRGIGRALCLQLAERGVHVYTCGRDEEALRETEEQAPGPGSVVGMVADVTDLESMTELFAKIRDERGHLDILVNNAGVLGPRARIEKVSLQEWRHTLTVNADGVFIASKLAMGLMRKSGGIMLNVSSSVGRKGRGGWGPYAVSKHALEGLTGTLADELEDDGICVVSVNPGGTATRMRKKAYPDEDPATLPTADEVAGTFMTLIERLDVAQTGRQYNSRDLMECFGEEMEAEELPYVGKA